MAEDRDGSVAVSPPLWKALAIAFVAASLVTFAAHWLGGIDKAPVLHPAMPLALGLVLRWGLPWLRAATLLLAAAVAVVSVHLLLGDVPVAAAIAGVAQLLESGLILAGLHALKVDRAALPGLRSLSALAALTLLAVVAPLAGALLALLAGVADPVAHALHWWSASTCAYLLLLPLLLAEARERAPSRQRVLAVGAMTTLACIASLALVPSPYALLAVLLLAPALWLGVGATAAIGLLVVVLPMAATALGLPGFETQVFDPMRHLLSSTLAVTTAVLVAVIEQHRQYGVQQSHHKAEALRLLRDHAPAAVFSVGRDLRLRSVNRRFEEWFGKPAAESIGRTLVEFFGKELAARLGSSRVSRVLTGQSQQFELEMPDGRELELNYEPQHGTEGDIDGFLAIAGDVSWRRDAQQKLALLFDAAPDALLVVGEGDRIVAANERLAMLFGYVADSLVGQPLALLIPGLGREAIGAANASVAAPVLRNTDEGAELQGRDLHGHHFAIELLPGAEQTVLGTGRLCAVRPVVSRELETRAQQRHKDRAQVILDAIGDAVVACDPDLFITLFNPVAEAMTGWRRAEALGRPLHDVVRMLDTSDNDRPLSPMQMALEAGCPLTIEAQTALIRREGERATVEVSAAPILDAEGSVDGGVMVFRDISQTHAMALQMSHLAQHDYLTHLPNRVLLHDRLSQELAKTREGRKGALLFLDLDFFKHINDSLGHAVGDKVLKEVSRRLLESVREDDTVSRQGGDEFVLMLVRMADPRDAARVAEKLIHAIEQPIHHEGQDLHVSASIGIALFPQDARDIKTLMMQADTALYHAKQSGRGRYSYFAGSMSERAEQRMRMEHDLRLALSHGDFFLVYQPKVRLEDGTITGMEALVRWRTSDGVLMSPGEFIPVAEETGLVVPLDEWVMREACRQNKAWQDEGLPCLPVSVNVSLARFDAERLLQSVRDTLAATGLAPQYLEIEFTESQMFVHQERAQQMISEFKALGVQLAVDDFGVGYSSLSYLVQYSFDTLKIDRSFISGLPGETKQYAVVQAIIGMAQALGYHVVAEGVETIEQANVLASHGCPDAQGFLFSRPVPADQLAGLLKRGEIRVPGMQDHPSQYSVS